MAPVCTRRQFIHTAAVTTLGAISSTGLLGCPPFTPPTSFVVFKRSGRGMRVSNAAKKHNANRLYRTVEAAQGDAPHPGDRSKVVELTISDDLFNRLFPNNGRLIADLRIHL